MSSLKLSLWACCLVGLVVSGCGEPNKPTTPQRVIPQERAFFSDVPLPVGFNINDRASEDRMSGERRIYVRHVYEGRGEAYAIRSFYLEQMPQYQWQVVSVGNTGGMHTIRLTKERESCTITVSAFTTRWRDGVRVEILITQESGAAATPRK
ncbi:MAG: hypothetical protein HJJLKODD_01018 [Phycisphaerae bacterium]|nr:hypothetical protein [Phycisphaerae bacterium]